MKSGEFILVFHRISLDSNAHCFNYFAAPMLIAHSLIHFLELWKQCWTAWLQTVCHRWPTSTSMVQTLRRHSSRRRTYLDMQLIVTHPWTACQPFCKVVRLAWKLCKLPLEWSLVVHYSFCGCTRSIALFPSSRSIALYRATVVAPTTPSAVVGRTCGTGNLTTN